MLPSLASMCSEYVSHAVTGQYMAMGDLLVGKILSLLESNLKTPPLSYRSVSLTSLSPPFCSEVPSFTVRDCTVSLLKGVLWEKELEMKSLPFLFVCLILEKKSCLQVDLFKSVWF